MEVVKQEGRTHVQGSCEVIPSDKYIVKLFKEGASIGLKDTEDDLSLVVDVSTEDMIKLAKNILKHYGEDK